MIFWKIGVKKCYRCGGVFDTDKMLIVKDTHITHGIEGEEVVICDNRYYCERCKPAYDCVDRTEPISTFTKMMDVNEKGEVIKKKRGLI